MGKPAHFDIFLTKSLVNGTRVWTRLTGTDGTDVESAVAAYVVGYVPRAACMKRHL